MPTRDDIRLVDSQLRDGIALFPSALPGLDDLDLFRESASRPLPDTQVPGLEEHHIRLDRSFGTGSIDIIVCRPIDARMLPAICCIHGGGYISGSAAKMASERRENALKMNCVLVFVDYALAPENPFPLPLEDCYRALRWMIEDGANFGIDPARIAVQGVSAGGGLAAALVILARDRGEFPILFQQLLCPMIDDRTVITCDPNPCAGGFVWTPESNALGWRAYLGIEPGDSAVSPYAAAARATDLSQLPPAFIAVGSIDLFLDENLDYALRLARAGVQVELHVYPGLYHGGHLISEADVSRAWERDSRNSMMKALHQRKPE